MVEKERRDGDDKRKSEHASPRICWIVYPESLHESIVYRVFFHIRKQYAEETPYESTRSRPVGKNTFVIVVHMNRQADLLQIVHTLSSLCGFAGRLYGRKQ